MSGEVGYYRFLPAFFFPPLAFFAMFCYPPLHVGILRERSHAPRWLPPGTLTKNRRSSRRWRLPFEAWKGEIEFSISLRMVVSSPSSYQM